MSVTAPQPTPTANAASHSGLIAALAAWLIGLYQRFLSPHKGYRCAYGVLYGQDSCSQAIKHTVLTNGVLAGLRALCGQFRACKEASLLLLARQEEEREAMRSPWSTSWHRRPRRKRPFALRCSHLLNTSPFSKGKLAEEMICCIPEAVLNTTSCEILGGALECGEGFACCIDL